MLSIARKRFDANAADIELLMVLYDALLNFTPSGANFGKGLEVLCRSAVVLMVSHWEAYVEDICTEGLEHLVEHVASADSLPKEIKKEVVKAIQASANEIEMWKLAGDGWKEYMRLRLGSLRDVRDKSFNTPKAEQTSDFVRRTLGIQNIRKNWTIDGEDPKATSIRLDKLVTVRGEIAHRGRVGEKLDRTFVTIHTTFLRKLVGKTDESINKALLLATGTPLF